MLFMYVHGVYPHLLAGKYRVQLPKHNMDIYQFDTMFQFKDIIYIKIFGMQLHSTAVWKTNSVIYAYIMCLF